MEGANTIPPIPGEVLGDVWFRGLPRVDHLLTFLREDFYIVVVGCMMKFIRLEKDENGLNCRARIVKTFNHGVDGVSAITGCPFRDVYALAERRLRPRIFIFAIHKTDRGELEPYYLHSLKRIHSWDIRSMHFISKELLVVLTGIPTFNVVLFRWNTNEELMSSQATEPNLFSQLLISPKNPCHWVEYGDEHMYVYEMASMSRNDVFRTQVNLQRRKIQYDHADPQMGRPLASKIVSACWTNSDEFYILDEQHGIHKYDPDLKVLQWTCSLKQTFLGCTVTQLVPYSDGLAAITSDGWFLNYGPITPGGTLEVMSAFKLSSNVLRYIQFPDIPETFYAITESKGAVEGVTQGFLRDPFTIPDIMFSDIIGCCFIEPRSEYMAIITKFGKIIVLECNVGEPIAKWKLPFEVCGIASHPALPFMFCGTKYGCVNVMDVRNLKTPKLINRRFFTREPNPCIQKFAFVAQGRYVISADVNNNRVFVSYGYPFMSFDFIDSSRVPARISHISVPGCGKDDTRFQVFMSGKSKSDEGVVAFLINFGLRNDRIMVLASQILDQPVTAMCLSPMQKYLYAFYPVKKALGVVAFCDDNQWLNLQEPEHYVECRFRHDVSFMVFNGDKLYTFGEDGIIQVHVAPVIPKKKTQLPMVLSTLASAQTHCYSTRGIKEGIVSLDGSQVIAIGHDGTFCRVKFFPKPKEPDWQTLGYDRQKLIDYQVGTYLIDQEFYKSGDDFVDRIADIKIHIDLLDPVNFYQAGEESDEEEDAPPNPNLPQADARGEKMKYGPRKSFKGSVRKKLSRVKFGDDSKHQLLSDKKSLVSVQPTEQTPGEKTTTPSSSPEASTVEAAPLAENVVAAHPAENVESAPPAENVESAPPAENVEAAPPAENDKGAPPAENAEAAPPAESDKGVPPADSDKAAPPAENVEAAPPAENVEAAPPAENVETVEQGTSNAASDDSPKPGKTLKPGASVAVQRLLSKVKDTNVVKQQEPEAEDTKQQVQADGKVSKTAAAPASSALRGVLSERMRRKQMAKDKSTKEKDKKGDKKEEAQPVEVETAPEAPVAEEPTDASATEEAEATTSGDESGKKAKGLKNLGDMRKAAKVLGLMFGKKKKEEKEAAGGKKVKKAKIKKFAGGQAGKMLAAQATSTIKVKAPPSRTARNRLGQAKLVKQLLDEEKDPMVKLRKKKKSILRKNVRVPEESTGLPQQVAMKGRKRREDEQSEASKALMMEVDMGKNFETSVLQDPAIYLVPMKDQPEYEGLDVEDVLTVHHAVRRKEYTESEFFAQFEKTLLYRQHIPKAQALRRELEHFTELMEDLMGFNKQREEGNQVEIKEFNFDEDREPRLHEKAQKMKKIAHIQMMVRNKLRHGKIRAMKHLVWDQFDTKGMTLMGFRKSLEVSNYPLLPEKEFYASTVTEGISWRRLELRLELDEADALIEANNHALRVLHHEMQYVPQMTKRLYMKSIMAIDPEARFDDYEASDSEQSDEEFFAKVFEELGIQPEEITGRGTIFMKSGVQVGGTDGPQSAKSDAKQAASKAKSIAGAVASRAAVAAAGSKFMKKGQIAGEKTSPDYKKLLQQQDSTGEAYVEKLKKWLLQEEEDEATYRLPAPDDSSVASISASASKVQSRRDFMINIKPSKEYYHAKGVFGPNKGQVAPPGRKNVGFDKPPEVETLMEPPPLDKEKSRESGGGQEDKVLRDYVPSEKKMRMVVRQRNKMKFQRIHDVIIDDEEDVSGPEDESVIYAQKQKFENMDEEYKERFETVNNIFFGSSVSELTDMYQYKPASYRYSQFELASRHELWRHHYIIQSEIYQMQKFFNRQFELLRNAKGYNLRKMSERNDRIREIYYYLKMDLELLDEKWHLQEDPSQIFTVTKEEMPCEKYLTAEQRELEEQRRLEDLARRRTRMAEFRKKALMVMMDNRLEVKREEMLINDIPKPPFMLEKDPLEFTLEEYLQSLQYAEAVEALEIARVELIKELEEELGRLYRANAMDINTIDLRVTELSIMKFQFHQNFKMEETRILRAIRQLRMMNELDREERRVSRIVHELKATMKGSQNLASHMENKRIICEEDITKFLEQERELERNFRRDLGDIGPYFEYFYKSYKKKPKVSMKGLNKAEVYETMVRALKADNIRVFARENGEVGRLVVMSIYDFEDPMLMPKDCPRSYWDKFNRVRRERLVCEYQTKALMAEIDRISEAISECNRKEAEGTATIAAVLGVVSHKNDMKNYFVANVEFQMILGKGQCEINCWEFKEHVNANIILIENVEKLNARIYEASDKLIKEMTKTAVVHRDIREVEWRFMVVEMATKDLKKVKHDVTCFKPTKKLLEVLRRGINLDTMHTDRIALVDYLRATYIKYQKIFLRTKKKLLRFYQHQTQRRHSGNDKYRGNILEQTETLMASQAVKFSPKMNYHSKEETERRAIMLMLRGYLNRKVIRLANELDRLEEELEKQYQRTYPVL